MIRTTLRAAHLAIHIAAVGALRIVAGADYAQRWDKEHRP